MQTEYGMSFLNLVYSSTVQDVLIIRKSYED
jgi:hypothetical protein